MCIKPILWSNRCVKQAGEAAEWHDWTTPVNTHDSGGQLPAYLSQHTAEFFCYADWTLKLRRVWVSAGALHHQMCRLRRSRRAKRSIVSSFFPPH